MKSQVQTIYHLNRHEGNVAIERVQDIEAILENNKRVRNDELDHKKFDGKDFFRVASVPLVVIEKIKNELGIDAFKRADHERFIKLLNEPDYAYLKTTKAII